MGCQFGPLSLKLFLEDGLKMRGQLQVFWLQWKGVASFFQGVVTAATSLITTLAQKNPEEFKTSVSLAVSRLSRVSLLVGTGLSVGFGLSYCL